MRRKPAYDRYDAIMDSAVDEAESVDEVFKQKNKPTEFEIGIDLENDEETSNPSNVNFDEESKKAGKFGDLVKKKSVFVGSAGEDSDMPEVKSQSKVIVKPKVKVLSRKKVYGDYDQKGETALGAASRATRKTIYNKALKRKKQF